MFYIIGVDCNYVIVLGKTDWLTVVSDLLLDINLTAPARSYYIWQIRRNIITILAIVFCFLSALSWLGVPFFSSQILISFVYSPEDIDILMCL